MSFRLATIVGIPVRLHWLFLVLVGLVLLQNGMTGGGDRALASLTLLGILFGSVVLHEFGHAVTARRFGARIVDITLWPLGGLTRMTQMPERPIPEMCVALAGPAVNALLLLIGVLAGGEVTTPWKRGGVIVPPTHADVFASVNFALAAFNLVPAFPMDGGRAFRAALAAKLGYLRATEVAVTIGRYCAFAAVVAAWFADDLFYPVLLIGVFLWIQGGQELRDVRMRYGIDPMRAALERMLRMQFGGAGAQRGGPPPEGVHLPGSPDATNRERNNSSAHGEHQDSAAIQRDLENYRGSMEEYFRERDRGSRP
jgi:stage IV sporulation protein FB